MSTNSVPPSIIDICYGPSFENRLLNVCLMRLSLLFAARITHCLAQLMEIEKIKTRVLKRSGRH